MSYNLINKVCYYVVFYLCTVVLSKKAVELMLIYLLSLSCVQNTNLKVLVILDIAN